MSTLSRSGGWLLAGVGAGLWLAVPAPAQPWLPEFAPSAPATNTARRPPPTNYVRRTPPLPPPPPVRTGPIRPPKEVLMRATNAARATTPAVPGPTPLPPLPARPAPPPAPLPSAGLPGRASPPPPPPLLASNVLAWDADTKQATARPGELNVHFTFWLTNISQTEVVIPSQPRTSCGCTVARLPQLPWRIPPGSNGAVEVTLNLAGRAGTVIKTVTVDTSVGPKTLTVMATVPASASPLPAPSPHFQVQGAPSPPPGRPAQPPPKGP